MDLLDIQTQNGHHLVHPKSSCRILPNLFRLLCCPFRHYQRHPTHPQQHLPSGHRNRQAHQNPRARYSYLGHLQDKRLSK